MNFTESIVEEASLAWIEGMGYAVLDGSEIVPDMPGVERIEPNYRDMVLTKLISGALRVKDAERFVETR
ncbi:MAG: hypothetical protein V1790_05115 [Planctomycetota bacterium]